MKKLQDIIGIKKVEILKKYEELFKNIMQNIHDHGIEQAGDCIVSYCKKFFSDANNIPDIQKTDAPYSRSHIGKNNDGWEAIIVGWNKDTVSSIHGHPSFALYYVISGEFEMKLFEKQGNKLIIKETRIFASGDYIYEYHADKNFENMIHQVRVRKAGYTLNIYSSNGLEGNVYPEEKII